MNKINLQILLQYDKNPISGSEFFIQKICLGSFDQAPITPISIKLGISFERTPILYI